MSVLLDVRGVTKSFGATEALKKADFSLQKGEIHALIGENGAGKSTLIKILSGVYKKDSGTIFLDSYEINPANPKSAQNMGISTVFQELSLCQNLTVAENIFVNREPSRFGFIKRKELFELSKKYLSEFHINIRPDILVRDLNLAQKQVIEILKAISIKAKVLVLDEPTSALEIAEVKSLFELLRKLKSNGTGIIFVSHKIDEIFEIADKITVFRDGEYIGTKNVNETGTDELVTMMIGRQIMQVKKSISGKAAKEILRIRDFSYQNTFSNVNFNLYEGEILGVAGLTGAGRSEVMQSIFGYREKDSGETNLNGKFLQIFNPANAIKNQIVYSPEDRKEQGLFLKQSIVSNISVICLKECSGGFLMNKEKESELARKFVSELSIKVRDINQSVDSLSGGNQQKVLLAKCLAAKPKVLIVDEPTRGIDVGSKIEIHQLLKNFVNEGGSIILISSDLPEIIGLSDRVLVFKEGRVIGELKESISEDSIMSLIFKDQNN